MTSVTIQKADFLFTAAGQYGICTRFPLLPSTVKDGNTYNIVMKFLSIYHKYIKFILL